MNVSLWHDMLSRFKLYIGAANICRMGKLLYPFVRQQWKSYAALLFLLAADIVLTLALAWCFGQITDAAMHSAFSRLRWLVPLGAACVVLNLVHGICSSMAETAATGGVKRELRLSLYRRLLLLPYPQLANSRSGEVASLLTNDIHSMDGVLGERLMELLRLPLTYIVVFVYLSHLNWRLSLLSLVFAPLVLAAGAGFGLLLRRSGRRRLELAGEMNHLLHDTLLGFPVVRAFTLERRFYARYAAQNDEVYGLERQSARLRSAYSAGGYGASAAVFLASLCLGSSYIHAGQMTVGSLFTYLNLVHHLVHPLTGLGGLWAGWQKAAAAGERIAGFLVRGAEQAETAQRVGKVRLARVTRQAEAVRQDENARQAAADELPVYTLPSAAVGAIHFDDVTFGFDGQAKIFEQLRLTIPAGGVTAIVGPSGAGKTTLFHLLQGFYRPDSGTVRLAETLIVELSPSERAGYFALVPQEPFFFAGTIRDNLLAVRPGIIEAEMMEAAKAADIHEFIAALPDGYDTELGERGIRLSGGQRQRLAIARALLKQAPILLLDEATSALDGMSECRVKETLTQLGKHSTVLVVAHRLSAIRQADRIIVLEAGRVVQTGRHAELIKQDGLYRRLYDSSDGQDEVEPGSSFALDTDWPSYV